MNYFDTAEGQNVMQSISASLGRIADALEKGTEAKEEKEVQETETAEYAVAVTSNFGEEWVRPVKCFAEGVSLIKKDAADETCYKNVNDGYKPSFVHFADDHFRLYYAEGIGYEDADTEATEEIDYIDYRVIPMARAAGNTQSRKAEIYDGVSRVLTDYENGEAGEKELYDALTAVQNAWEAIITAED